MRALILALAIAALPSRAVAHGLGERYDLPLPLELYLYGAASVVALSFLVMALFAGRPGVSDGVLRLRASQSTSTFASRATLLTALLLPIRIASALLFLLVVTAGFIGNQDPFRNLAPVTVWVLGWVGLAFVSALVGNVWAVLNPWDNLFRLSQAVTGRLRKPLLPFPERLGAWPAFALFLVFAWMELIWPGRDHPANVSAVLAVYSVITWCAMAVFGRRAWLANGEIFSVVFGLLSRFALLDIRDGSHGTTVRLRPFFAAGLLLRDPVPVSMAALALLILATVTFDGLIETPLWATIVEAAFDSRILVELAERLGVDLYLLLITLAFIAFPLIAGSCFLAVTTVMAHLVRAGSDKRSDGIELACLFAFSLVPIAIGYHLAHYLSYLLISGQFIIPIASDPFGWGWNLFGTRLYLIDIGIVDARFVWYASLTLIVGGHVFAVCLAHLEAEHRFAGRRQILVSQGPMLALMVAYTALSLWILAQPIVETSGQA